MENNRIRVAITQGDTNGVGYEMIFRIFSEPEMLDICTPIIYGSPKAAAYHSKILQTDCQFCLIKSAEDAHNGKVNLLAIQDAEPMVDFGKKTPEAQAAAEKALSKAMTDARGNLVDVLVCGPMEKPDFETDDESLQIIVNRSIRMAFATNGSMGNVAENISVEGICEKIKKLQSALKKDFRISDPRIAVLALNKEDAREENEVMKPAIEASFKEGVRAFGPYQAESFFSSNAQEDFDGILAMCSEQGMTSLRTHFDDESIMTIANAPIVCTMPNNDAQYEIAGKNEADTAQMRNAIYAAIDICRHRKEYEEPARNPLPKLYHERPDNGEKLRFAIPKKAE